MNRRFLNEELNALKEELVKMCRLAEAMIEDAVASLFENDAELAKRTVENDSRVDELELAIEKRCMRILLKEQPVASDFRLVSTTLKVITDVERIGDQAEDIAATGLLCPREVRFGFLKEMSALAVRMVRESVNSFLRGDEAMAEAAVRMDDRMDALFSEAKKILINEIKTAAENADEILYVLMIAKYLERIGDHAVNVCEWTKYSKSGVHEKFQ